MAPIPVDVIYIIVSIAMGFIGAPVRMYAQYLNGKLLDTDPFSVFARGFMSAIAGLVYYLITGWGINDVRIIALGALIAGYTGVDFVENALGAPAN